MRSLVLALFVLGFAATAHAQNANRQQNLPAQPLDAAGTIHSLTPTQINVLTTANQPWQIQISDSTKVTVKGQGTPDMLAPRMGVRFHAVLSKRGVALEPIEKITIFTPAEMFAPVVELAPEEEEEGEESAEGQGEEKATEEEEKAKEDESKEGEEKPRERAQGDKAPRSIATPFDNIGKNQEALRKQARQARGRGNGREGDGERYFVAGVLVSARRGKLVVNVGEAGKVKAELGEDAAIEVDFTTHMVARPGDSVVVKGVFYTPGQGVARTVDITLSPPAEKEAIKPGNRRRKGRISERDQESREDVPAFGDPG